MKKGIVIFIILITHEAFAQCLPLDVKCDPTGAMIILPVEPVNLTFTFDNFSSYNGGITYTAATILKIKAINNPAQICKWHLTMFIKTTAVIPTDWETKSSYGGSGTVPTLDILKIRVSNFCGTPISNNILMPIGNTNGDFSFIINDPITNNFSGSTLPGTPPCGGGETNTEGSYLTNYGEYSFNVDYTLIPGLSFLPGRYEISVKFCLTE